MENIISSLKNPRYKDYLFEIEQYIPEVDEIITTSNKSAINSVIASFRNNDNIILKDVSYLFGDPENPRYYFDVVHLHGIKKSEGLIPYDKIYIYEKGGHK